MSLKWNTRIQVYGTSLSGGELTNHLDKLIQDALQRVSHLGKFTDQQPTVGETIDKVGKAAISSQLTSLGNRVGGEFEREVRQRITDLHTWQERSIREIATRLAEERIGLI